MNKQDIKKTIEELKKNSPKRKFNQSFDLILSYKNIDIKKPEQQLDFYITVPHSRGREIRTCALVGPELLDNAKESCSTVIAADEFDRYAKDKKLLKKVGNDHDFFIAQATIMPKVAATFGRVLGPRGKMPNPKAGCVVPPNANLKPLHQKLQKTVRVIAKTSPMTQIFIGKENEKEDEIVENIAIIYDQVIHHLPAGKDNVKAVFLKLTMSKPMKIPF